MALTPRKSKYLVEAIFDPVAVLIFKDKAVIISESGQVTERAFETFAEDYYDMPEGHG